MSIYDTDWQNFRLSHSDLPTDVTFRIKEQLKDGIYDVVGVDVMEENVKAHRFLLAGVSSVFRAQFFGPLKEEKMVIEIRETTIEAFKDMIDWIYKVPTEMTIDCQDYINKVPTEMTIDRQDDISHMFEVFNIANKYQICSLATSIEGIIANVRLTRKNVLEIAKVTEKFRHFDKLANRLTERCSDFLRKDLKSKEDICWFLASRFKQNSDKENTVMLKLLSMNARCPNCKQSECLDGQVVTSDSVSIGMKVVPVPKSAGASFGDGTVGTITKILDQQIPYVEKEVLYILWGNGTENALYMQSKGNHNFMIKC